MNTKRYLKRIGISQDVDISTHSLKLIQKQHLLTVPFENLDIHIHKKLTTDLDVLYYKIVEWQRGGICYELNGLLALLLHKIGFDVQMLGGKVLEDNGSYCDHLLLSVQLENEVYLTDVGFGDNFLEPLLFIPGMVQQDAKGTFRIDSIDDIHYALKKYDDSADTFKTEYVFKNTAMHITDFSERMDYFTHSPQSIFKKNLFCSLERENGRISLKHNVLICTHTGEKILTPINSLQQYIQHLENDFNITMSDDDKETMNELWPKYQ